MIDFDTGKFTGKDQEATTRSKTVKTRSKRGRVLRALGNSPCLPVKSTYGKARSKDGENPVTKFTEKLTGKDRGFTDAGKHGKNTVKHGKT